MLDLRLTPVAKSLGDTTVRMLGCNGSIPGPTLKVRQGLEIIVDDAPTLADRITAYHRATNPADAGVAWQPSVPDCQPTAGTRSVSR